MKRTLSSFIIMALAFTSVAFGETKPFSQVIQEIKTSVVAVGTFNIQRNPRGVLYGSGVLISPNGLIVTANHVINMIGQNNEKDLLRVFLYQDDQDRGYAARIITQSLQYDLALLQIEGKDFPYLEKGNSSQLKEGDQIAFCGYPYGLLLGLRPTTHRGMISSISPNVLPVISTKDLSPEIKRALATKYNIFHLDATVYPGQSGGPLFDPETGKVLGIMSCGLFAEGNNGSKTKFIVPTGISYAIPIEHVDQLIPQEK